PCAVECGPENLPLIILNFVLETNCRRAARSHRQSGDPTRRVVDIARDEGWKDLPFRGETAGQLFCTDEGDSAAITSHDVAVANRRIPPIGSRVLSTRVLIPPILEDFSGLMIVAAGEMNNVRPILGDSVRQHVRRRVNQKLELQTKLLFDEPPFGGEV